MGLTQTPLGYLPPQWGAWRLDISTCTGGRECLLLRQLPPLWMPFVLAPPWLWLELLWPLYPVALGQALPGGHLFPVR